MRAVSSTPGLKAFFGYAFQLLHFLETTNREPRLVPTPDCRWNGNLSGTVRRGGAKLPSITGTSFCPRESSVTQSDDRFAGATEGLSQRNATKALFYVAYVYEPSRTHRDCFHGDIVCLLFIKFNYCTGVPKCHDTNVQARE